MILRFLKQNKKYCIQHGIAKSGAKVLNSRFVLLSPPKTNFIRFLFLNLTHKNSFWLASVQNRNFQLRFPRLRQYPKRSEEIPSGFPRYGSGLHTSSTALRDCPRTWVSRKRETCVKPRAVMRQLKRRQQTTLTKKK